jgi:PTH1 family peptidyl-tRNA hydrolase
MKLVIGLGNPEEKYHGTRHNVGFAMVEMLANDFGASFQEKSKFKAHIAETTVNGEKLLLAKPTTYYNLSGEAMRLIADFYKIDIQDILIIHDELALPLATLRTRKGGSDAGNNGVKSINEHGGEQSARIRIGIWNELRDRMDDVTFVLGKFSADELKTLKALEPTVMTLVRAFTNDSFDVTTHRAGE